MGVKLSEPATVATDMVGPVHYYSVVLRPDQLDRIARAVADELARRATLNRLIEGEHIDPMDGWRIG